MVSTLDKIVSSDTLYHRKECTAHTTQWNKTKVIGIPVCWTNTIDIYNNNIQCQRVDIFQTQRKMCKKSWRRPQTQAHAAASITKWVHLLRSYFKRTISLKQPKNQTPHIWISIDQFALSIVCLSKRIYIFSLTLTPSLFVFFLVCCLFSLGVQQIINCTKISPRASFLANRLRCGELRSTMKVDQ